MTIDFHRRSIRWANYDYTRPGAYYLTFRLMGRNPLFGDVADGVVVLSDFGRIAESEWRLSSNVRSEIQLDDFVVMPDHVHALVWLRNNSVNRLSSQESRQLQPGSVGALVAGYKSSVTRQINEIRNMPGSPVWQRGFHDRVVRDEQELQRIRAYIAANPLNWSRS